MTALTRYKVDVTFMRMLERSGPRYRTFFVHAFSAANAAVIACARYDVRPNAGSIHIDMVSRWPEPESADEL